MTKYNIDIIKRFWEFVKENNDEGLLIAPDETSKFRIIAFFDVDGRAIKHFFDEYIDSDGEFKTVPCELVSCGAIKVIITPEILGMESFTNADYFDLYNDAWNGGFWGWKPRDLKLRTEW